MKITPVVRLYSITELMNQVATYRLKSDFVAPAPTSCPEGARPPEGEEPRFLKDFCPEERTLPPLGEVGWGL